MKSAKEIEITEAEYKILADMTCKGIKMKDVAIYMDFVKDIVDLRLELYNENVEEYKKWKQQRLDKK